MSALWTLPCLILANIPPIWLHKFFPLESKGINELRCSIWVKGSGNVLFKQNAKRLKEDVPMFSFAHNRSKAS